MRIRPIVRCSVAALLAAAAGRAGAQDSLRVLRIAPADSAWPGDPVVITFDHPVAPRLEASIRASSVIAVRPALARSIYWRDPSTLIVELDGARPPVSSFTVKLAPTLRSASGLALSRADTVTRVVRIRAVQVLVARSARPDGYLDTVPHVLAVTSGGSSADWMNLRVQLMSTGCGGAQRGDSMAMHVESARAIISGDAYEVQQAGGYERDRRRDSLRRVIQLGASGSLPRGCPVRFVARRMDSGTLVYEQHFTVRPAFNLISVSCASNGGCVGLPVILEFNANVSASEIRAAVRFDGAPPAIDGNATAMRWTVHPPLAPATTHRLTVAATLRSAEGETLGTERAFTLEVPHRTSTLEFLTGSYVVPLATPVLTHVRHTNTDSVVVVVGRIADSSLASVLSMQNRYVYGRPAWRAIIRDSIVLRYATPEPDDSASVLTVPFDDLPVDWRHVPVALRARMVARVMPPVTAREALMRNSVRVTAIGPYGDQDKEYAVVRRSDLAIHRLAANNEAHVWVTSLRTAAPVSGARLRVLAPDGHAVAQGTSDADGLAVLAWPASAVTDSGRRELVLETRHDDDVALNTVVAHVTPADRDPERTQPGDGNGYDWRWAASSLTHLNGAAFSERGIYRPGERVYLKGIVQSFEATRGYATPAGDSSRWIIAWGGSNRDADRVWSRRHTLGEFGTVVDTFSIPRTARLGSYDAALWVRHDAVWRPVTSTSFLVAEYRVPEFAVAMSSDSSKRLFTGDTATVDIAARYLFGMPMQHAEVKWWSETSEADGWRVVPGLEGMSVGRAWWMQRGGQRPSSVHTEGSAITDDAGRLTVHVPLAASARPARATVYATITDMNRQTVTNELSVPVLAAEVEVGVKFAAPRWVWPAGTPIDVQALVVDLVGARRAGVSIHTEAVRRTWISDGSRYEPVWRDSAISSLDTLRFRFTPDSAGEYEVIVSARDTRGRTATSSTFAWVTSADSRYATAPAAALTIRAEERQYEPGDSASFAIESPDAGPAWARLVRGGILWERIVRLARGTNTLTVPISGLAQGGANLELVALRDGSESDTSDVHHRIAQRYVDVATTPSLLHVTIAPDRQRYAPRDTVRLALTVRDASRRGARSELAVWAVDEGVTSLTGMQAPAVLRSLFGWAPNPYTFATTLDALLPHKPDEWMWSKRIMLRGMSASAQLNEVVVTSVAMSSSVAMDASAIRQTFTTTPLYLGSVVTDSGGSARASFALPDNLTTFRIFAIATARGARAGSGDTAVVSARTLAVRPALPRVIRDGDSLFAGALVTQDRDGLSPLRLRVEGSGVRITGPTVLDATLANRRPNELRFSLQGTGADTAVLRFFGATPRDSDAAEARLPLSPSGHARARVVMGTLSGAARVGFQLDEPLDLARSRMQVQLGSSPLPLLRRLAETLRLYPYLCTEQLSSGGRALVARLRAERLLAPTAPLAPGDRAQLEMAVATIVARQRSDGGFGYWSATGWTSAWLTVYALEFLEGARELGVDVPAAAPSAARKYLGTVAAPAARWQTAPQLGRSDSIQLAHELLAVAVALRDLRMPDSALEARAIARAATLDWVDRLAMARLLAARGDSTLARMSLAHAWLSARTEGRRIVVNDSVAPRYWLFRSIMRPLTSLLITTVALTPDDPRIDPLFESVILVARSERGGMLNTIDQALIADAASAVLRARATRGTPATITVSGGAEARPLAQLAASAEHGDTASFAAGSFVASSSRGDSAIVRLSSDSKAPVYFAATLLEVPTSRPVRADDAGISVEKWYEGYGDSRPVVAVKAGDLVRVRIRVTVPADREFVAIDDPLPSGLEAVDLSLRTSSALPPFAGAQRIAAEERAEGPLGQRWLYGSWDGGWWVPWEHREIRDDRVVYFARQLWKGSYLISYVARATTAGVFVRPPAHAEEMYNPAVHGRSDGGSFTVTP